MKKTMKHAITTLCILVMAMLMTVSVSAASPKLSAKKATVLVGSTKTLKVTGSKKKVKWSSSNKKVATVNANGVVTGKKKGKATITAKVGSKKLKCKITVSENAYNNNINWSTVEFCNTEHMYFIQAAPSKLWYNSNGELCANIAIRNATLGYSYKVKYLYLKIMDTNFQTIAEGTVQFDNWYVNPCSVSVGTVRFTNGCTLKKITLSSLKKGFYWKAATSMS